MTLPYQTFTKQRFSLYLQPEGKSLDILTTAMSTLADEYMGPKFVPHVTLLPERWATMSEIVSLTQEIAKTITSLIPITLTDISMGSTHFKCVFFTILETPELLLLARKAREVFGVTPEEVPFSAHVSMLYDGFDSTKTVLSIKQKETATQLLRNQITLPFSYDCSGIAIHTSTPVVSEWQQVAFVPFG